MAGIRAPPEGSYCGWLRYPAAPLSESPYAGSNQVKEIEMPVILWLLGVPLGIVILLMLFGVL